VPPRFLAPVFFYEAVTGCFLGRLTSCSPSTGDHYIFMAALEGVVCYAAYSIYLRVPSQTLSRRPLHSAKMFVILSSPTLCYVFVAIFKLLLFCCLKTTPSFLVNGRSCLFVSRLTLPLRVGWILGCTPSRLPTPSHLGLESPIATPLKNSPLVTTRTFKTDGFRSPTQSIIRELPTFFRTADLPKSGFCGLNFLLLLSSAPSLVSQPLLYIF